MDNTKTEIKDSFLQQEAAYRRGFQQGYVAAIEDFKSLMEKGYSPKESIQACYEFQEGAGGPLYVWRHISDASKQEPPPEMRIPEYRIANPVMVAVKRLFNL